MIQQLRHLGEGPWVGGKEGERQHRARGEMQSALAHACECDCDIKLKKNGCLERRDVSMSDEDRRVRRAMRIEGSDPSILMSDEDIEGSDPSILIAHADNNKKA